MNSLLDYDYCFCTADCKHADCFRNRCNLPKGQRMIYTAADLSKTTECPHYVQPEEDDDTE